MAIQRSNINRMLGGAGKLDLRFLTFTALEDNSTVQLNSNDEELQYLPDEVFLEYCINGGKWQNYNFVTTTDNATGMSIINGDVITLLKAGDFVQFRARTHEVNGVSVNTNGAFAKMGNNQDPRRYNPMGYHFWNTSKPIACSGNIMSLLYKYVNNTTVPDCAFYALFKGSKITTTPFLGGTILHERGYAEMFNGCTYLTTATFTSETIQAVTSSLVAMFSNCSALVDCNGFSITSISGGDNQHGMRSMFEYCTSLEKAPKIVSSSSVGNDAYKCMYRGCSALKDLSDFQGYLGNPKYWVYQDFGYLFKDCTALEEIGKTIYYNAYTQASSNSRVDGMFEGCTNLKSAVIFQNHADTFNSRGMFKGCSSLSFIAVNNKSWYYGQKKGVLDCMPLNKLRPVIEYLKQDNTRTIHTDNQCAKEFCSGVASSGTFLCPDELPDARGTEFIPENWEVERYTPDDYFCITAEEDDSSVVLYNGTIYELEYKTNSMSDWEYYPLSTDEDVDETEGLEIILQHIGDNVMFRRKDDGDAIPFRRKKGILIYSEQGKLSFSGNIASLMQKHCCISPKSPVYLNNFLMDGKFENIPKITFTSSTNLASLAYDVQLHSMSNFPKRLTGNTAARLNQIFYNSKFQEGFIPETDIKPSSISNMLFGNTNLTRVICYNTHVTIAEICSANTLPFNYSGVLVVSPLLIDGNTYSFTVKTFCQDACDRFSDIASMVTNYPALEGVINAHPFLIDLLHQYNGLVHSLVNTGYKPYMIPHGDIYETNITLMPTDSFSMEFEKQYIDDCVGAGSIGRAKGSWGIGWSCCFEDITDPNVDDNITHTFYIKDGTADHQPLSNAANYISDNISVGKHTVEIGRTGCYYTNLQLDGNTPTSGYKLNGSFRSQNKDFTCVPQLYINGVARQLGDLNAFEKKATSFFDPFFKSDAKYFDIKVYKAKNGTQTLAHHIVPIAAGVFADITDLDNIKTYTSDLSHSYIFGSGVESRTSEFGTEAISS